MPGLGPLPPIAGASPVNKDEKVRRRKKKSKGRKHTAGAHGDEDTETDDDWVTRGGFQGRVTAADSDDSHSHVGDVLPGNGRHHEEEEGDEDEERRDSGLVFGAQAGPKDFDVENDDDGDELMQESKFNRSRTMAAPSGSLKQEESSTHKAALLWASVTLLVVVADLVTDYVLIADYYNHDLPYAALGMWIVHLMVAISYIVMEHANHGLWRFFWLDLVQCRVIFSYFKYVYQWVRHRHRPWPEKDFLGSTSFDSFHGSAPSLVVQLFVLFTDERDPSTIQIVSFFFTAVHMLIQLLHHFKYVIVSNTVYMLMMAKAVVSTGLRTALVAVLLIDVGAFLYVWALASLIGAYITYKKFLHYTRQNRDDDTLVHESCHRRFGLLCSFDMLFISFPFAPTHSVWDWWWGYLLSECKIQLENALMIVVVLIFTWSDPDRTLFYAAVFFSVTLFLSNLVILWLLHFNVRHQLVHRNKYTDRLIVKLFAHLCHDLKKKLDSKTGLTSISSDNGAGTGDAGGDGGLNDLRHQEAAARSGGDGEHVQLATLLEVSQSDGGGEERLQNRADALDFRGEVIRDEPAEPVQLLADADSHAGFSGEEEEAGEDERSEDGNLAVIPGATQQL